MFKKFAAGAVFLALLIFTGFAHADERITDFSVVLTVGQTGVFTVTETITVDAEGRKIKRGIFRDFPRTFIDDDGKTKRVSFSVKSIKRDGKSENYKTEWQSSRVRIYIGNEDVFLPAGSYTYEITYETDRQFRYLENHDEVSWNVTGTQWDFPIDKASARVILPDGATITEINFFTGFAGQAEKNARAEIEENGKAALFYTTAPLARSQGLTVAVKIPKGQIQPPSANQRWWFWFLDFGHIVIAAATFLIVSLYYLGAWVLVGRDPAKKTVVPRWDAPEGFSPALVNYIDMKGLDGKGFEAISSALMSLAVKGYVTIDKNGKDLSVTAASHKTTSGLPVGEASLFRSILKKGKFNFSKSNGSSVRSLVNNFGSAMEREHRNIYYKKNYGWVIFGLILSALGVVATVPFSDLGFVAILISVGCIFVGFMVVLPFLKLVRALLRGRRLSFRLFFSMIASVLPIFIFGGFAGTVAADFLQHGELDLEDTTIAFFVLVFAIAVINGLFYFLMGAPTKLGADASAHVQGLETYLTYTEKDRLALTQGPDMSPQHYETMLPYAIALGVEKKWTNTFTTWLSSAAAAAAGAANYSPGWSNSFDSRTDIGDYLSSMGNSVASSVASSMPAPKSSNSSFGGGGSVGGGGGGGGGGGW